ncbi:MAG: hypothetical protein AAGC55_00320 [Myxococcota bacterium]
MVYAAAACALLACGGVDVPEHNGYRGKSRAWEKPKVLSFDEDQEAEAEGELSYPKRRRARWFAVELPDDGDLEVQVEALPLRYAAENTEFEDEDDPFDVAFEVYNTDYKMLIRADREDTDAGDDRRSRNLPGLAKGRYLIHLYLQRRLDEAEYFLRLKYEAGAADIETDFPTQVAFIEPLPVVPAFDDAPDRIGRRPTGKRPRPNGKRPPPDKKPQKDPNAVPSGTISARIIGVRQASNGGTHITIDVGSSRGVKRGWKGKVVTKKGRSIPGGSFTIKKVNARTSTATVGGASPDSVTGAQRVRLTVPDSE